MMGERWRGADLKTVQQQSAVSDSELKQYQISIQGNRFAIASAYGEEHVRQVERLLEQQIEEIQQQAGLSGGTQTLILAALNITDQLLKLRMIQQNQDADLMRRVEVACEKLEHALNPS